MANPYNPKRKRGGEWNRSVKTEVRSKTDIGSTSRLVAEGSGGYSPAMFECYGIVESTEDHIVPRKSLTIKQHLGLFSQKFETEAQRTAQMDRMTGRIVPTTDQRVVWKSDKTLLRKGKPLQHPAGFKRITSKSKKPTFVEEPIEQAFEISVSDIID